MRQYPGKVVTIIAVGRGDVIEQRQQSRKRFRQKSSLLGAQNAGNHSLLKRTTKTHKYAQCSLFPEVAIIVLKTYKVARLIVTRPLEAILSTVAT